MRVAGVAPLMVTVASCQIRSVFSSSLMGWFDTISSLSSEPAIEPPPDTTTFRVVKSDWALPVMQTHQLKVRSTSDVAVMEERAGRMMPELYFDLPNLR